MKEGLTSREALKELTSQKTLYAGKFFSVKVKKNKNITGRRFFIIPSTVSKKAVVRNKLRRRARAIVGGAGLDKNLDLVVFLKKGSDALSFGQLREELLRAVNGIK